MGVKMNKYHEVEHPEAYEAAIKRNIINNAKTTFLKREQAGEVVAWLMDNAIRSTFAQSLLDGYNSFGKLTEGQFAAVLRCIEKDKQKQAEWKANRLAESAKSDYVGEVGKRIAISAKIVHVIELDGYYGTSWIHLMDDENGNRLVYKGSSFIGDKGDSVKMMAGVKEHQLRDGCKQTVLARPSKVETKEFSNL